MFTCRATVLFLLQKDTIKRRSWWSVSSSKASFMSHLKFSSLNFPIMFANLFTKCSCYKFRVCDVVSYFLPLKKDTGTKHEPTLNFAVDFYFYNFSWNPSLFLRTIYEYLLKEFFIVLCLCEKSIHYTVLVVKTLVQKWVNYIHCTLQV